MATRKLGPHLPLMTPALSATDHFSHLPLLTVNAPRRRYTGPNLPGSLIGAESLLHGSSGSTSRPSVIRPPPVRFQERTCWQALYQASPPPSSAQEKRARGRS
jgi:hypothetical protein